MSINNDILDFGLNYVTGGSLRLDICHTQEPTTYTEATSTYSCGNKTGITISGPSNSASGRKVTIDAITDGSVTDDAIAEWWALTDGISNLIAVYKLIEPIQVYNSNIFTLDGIDINTKDVEVNYFISDSVLDNGLDYLTNNGLRLDLCSSLPSDWNDILTYTRGNKTSISVGSPEDGSSGRKVVVPAVIYGVVTSTGACDYWALSDGSSELLAAGPLTAQINLTSTSNLWQLDEIDIEFPGVDPLTPLLPIPPTTFSVPYNLPTGGATITVGSDPGDDYDETELQLALNAASLGDVIILRAGDTFTGNFTLTSRSGTGWLYIISSELASLPAEDTRVTPEDAVNMPKLTSPTELNPVLIIEPGVENCRFVGIELTTDYASTASVQYGLVRVGWDNVNAGLLIGDPANNIVLDRCFVHGTSTGNIRDGIVSYNVTNFAIIDSHVSDFHGVGYESHGIHVFNSPGPTKIVNNYIEAGGINLFVGDSSIGGAPSPADLEVVGNHLYKPWSWNINRPEYGGIHWLVKNTLEIKAAERILIEGNLFENSWIDGQHGDILVVTPRGGLGADVIVRNNVLCNFDSGMTFNNADVTLNRVLVENNILYNLLSTDTFFIALAGNSGGFSDITIRHNTQVDRGVTNGCLVYYGDGEGAGNEITRFAYHNNLVVQGSYGVFGNNKPVGLPATSFYVDGYDFQSNAVIAADPSYFSGSDPNWAGWLFPADFDEVEFTNTEFYSISDFKLLNTSPYYQAGTDGKDIGADIDEILATIHDIRNVAPYLLHYTPFHVDNFDGSLPDAWDDPLITQSSGTGTADPCVNYVSEGLPACPTGNTQGYRQWWDDAGRDVRSLFATADSLGVNAIGRIADGATYDVMCISYWQYYDPAFDIGTTTGFKQVIIQNEVGVGHTGNVNDRNQLYLDIDQGGWNFFIQYTTPSQSLYSNINGGVLTIDDLLGVWTLFEFNIKTGSLE